ncbi:hypothetical protein ACIRRH_41205 [Kitasatospora sp. NPDC101235]|uniref:hypothetical protein n=1 Tax=Kitasatospora sp. NPDC101235 TaxID=3364101 RepID=UPI003802F575
MPTRRLVRACSDCYEIDHPAQTCQSAAAERAALRRLLDDATSRIVRDWDDGYGNPGPAFTSR